MSAKLPNRVYKKHGAYYYVTPVDRKWVRLGKTESEMYNALAKLMDFQNTKPDTMAHYFARYQKEVLPTKSARTQQEYAAQLKTLSVAFGAMHPEQIKPAHVYQYMDARIDTKVAANREKALLSTVYAYLIRWGIVEVNPCKVVKSFTEKARDRYVTDAEYQAVLALASPVMRAAMEIAVNTGMRQGDILKLKYADCTQQGIPVTQNKTGKKQIFEWTPGLIDALESAKSHKRHADSISYIIANGHGQAYTSAGFRSNWQAMMKKALDTGAIKNHFTFHDLRAKAGSDTQGNAQELLGHASAATTNRIYKRKPTVIKPIR